MPSPRPSPRLERELAAARVEREQQKEIEAGLMRWEPGSLSQATINRIALDALSDMWQDCLTRYPTCSRNLFRERVQAHLLAATGERMIVR